MRPFRRMCGAIGVLALSVTGIQSVTVAAETPRDDDHPVYLALGDSVVFGYITQAGFEYLNADNFVGYPAYVARPRRLTRVNASCPGETTGSFLAPDGIDLGCRRYRAQAPLHAPYTSTQLDFATNFLAGHRDTRLVTITLGANDLFLLEANCAGDLTCIAAGLPRALADIDLNLESILAALRATRFEGALVVANYYSLDYTDPARTGIVQLLNQTLATAAAAHDAIVADVFTAFQRAAATPFAGGSPCRAALLNAFPGDPFSCDIHPSQSGQRLIAHAIQDALPAESR